MLKLTLKPGEFINIGKDVKIVFSRGSANNIHLLVDAPKELNIVRSKTLEQRGVDAPVFLSEKELARKARMNQA